MWIFPEVVFKLFIYVLWKYKKKYFVYGLLIILKSFSYVLNHAPQQQTKVQFIPYLMLSSEMGWGIE